MAAQTQSKYVILGQITDQLNRPQANLLVQAYSRSMRSQKLLGECLTDSNGNYTIEYLYGQSNRIPSTNDHQSDNDHDHDDLTKRSVKKPVAGRSAKGPDISLQICTPTTQKVIYTSDLASIRYNASAREKINVTITMAIPPDQIEYESIVNAITPLIGKVKISDLQENITTHDIAFLSNQAGILQAKLEHVVVANRLSDATKVDPTFFYAILRENTLLKNDLTTTYQARLSIDVNTDIKTLIYDVVLADPKQVQNDVDAAVQTLLVPSSVSKQCSRDLAKLSSYKKAATTYYTTEYPQKVVGIISQFVLQNKIAELGQAFQANKNDLNAFFSTMSNFSLFPDKTTAINAQTTATLSQLLGFNSSLVDQVQTSQGITKSEDVKKLASLKKSDWVKMLNQAAKKIDVADNSIDLYASSLVRQMEKRFPSAAFAAQLTREKKTILKNQEAINNFFKAYDDFDLKDSNIDVFLKQKNIANQANEAMRAELKAVQRVFKLVPNYSKTNALMQRGITSAHSIVSAGKSQFVNQIAPAANMSATEAQQVFATAQQKTAAAMLIAGDLNDISSSMNIPAIQMPLLEEKLTKVTQDFPNLQSLFQLTDACACQDCRSVLSPAAYLVEILQFISNRTVTDLTTNTTSNLAKDVLFARRPDLGDIDLGCENAETPLPYIDLVCEILEQTIAPDPGIAFTGNLSDGTDPLSGKVSAALLSTLVAAGIPVTDQALIFHTETSQVSPIGSTAALPHYLRDTKAVCKIVSNGGNKYTVFQLRQTLASADELAAAPEYVNQNAYTILNTSTYAFTLPFDLNHVEGEAYFSRFGINRYDLMTDFQVAGAPTDQSIAAEQLGLTDTERSLIVTPDPTHQQQYWNTTTAVATTDMQVVSTFLTKSGLSYADLVIFLSLKFINQTDNLFIQNLDMSCDTTQKQIANLSDPALDRIHRFLRLQKITGWGFDTLDAIISQSNLGNGVLDDSCLMKAAALVSITQATGLSLQELMGFYGSIPYAVLPNRTTDPLYTQVFLNKAKNGFVDPGLLPANVNGAQNLSTYANSLSICLQISAQDLNLLLAILPNGSLTFANLSSLFAYTRLARKLKLKIADFITMQGLIGINVQASPQTTLAFVNALILSRTIPLKPADIAFILNHQAIDLTNREFTDVKVTQILQTIQMALKSAYMATQSPFDSNLTAIEQEPALQSLLATLTGVSDDDVKTLISYITPTWTSAAATAAITFVNTTLGNLFDTTAITSAITMLSGAGIPNDTQQLALVKAFMDTVANYNYVNAKQAALQQIIATALNTTIDLASIVLVNAKLGQPSPGTALIGDILSADALIDKADTTQPTITNAAFPSQYETIRLLHKLFPLIDIFSSDNIAWYFENNSQLGWFTFDSIPYQAGQNPISYDSFVAFVQMDAIATNLSPVINPADADNPITFQMVIEMLLPGSTATRDQFIQAFCTLTGYDQDTMDDLDAYLFPVFSLNNYTNVSTWNTVQACMNDLRLLGSTVALAQEFIKPVLTAADTNLLCMSLKARYDETTWLTTLKQIMDAIRPQKRDALVAYLLATNTDMTSSDDLYDYYLVDVEMQAVMQSSRIVLAHGTVQLFVQRCILGLEPQAAADISIDQSWTQWEWMANYRVWEANRQIFLYPENWITPSLRTDSSFQFQQLENNLLQNGLTEDTAEDAITEYLESLDTIAFLEVVATWYEVDIRTMHVFGRTKGGTPATYYYRQFQQERVWTPWTEVKLDITSDHLLAFVRNSRLCLAWPIFSNVSDPNPESSVPSSSDMGTTKANDKPKNKLQIQIAVSEYANQQWLPKKVSEDFILTPSDYTTDEFPQDAYNLMYLELTQQIWVFSSTYNSSVGDESFETNGVFNLTGCKGYPELAYQGNYYFPEFLPIFKDTQLLNQRFTDSTAPDLLEVINGISIFLPYTILKTTPANFRLTYPLQMTEIDYVVVLIEYLLMSIYGEYKFSDSVGRYFKIPLGTLLPYFMEDSNHGYVITPGFYNRQESDNGFIYTEQTASDILQLIDEIIAIINKYIALYNADPSHDINALLQKLVQDPDYQKIVNEFKLLKTLRYGEKFANNYHPLICPLRKTLYADGIPALMNRDTQLQTTAFNFDTNYQPTAIVPQLHPVEDIDFSSDGSYSGYNWELFYHIPFLLATEFTTNQQFQEAMDWFHYIFNPTGALSGTVPQKYWVTKPFYLRQTPDYIDQRIDTLLYNVADPNNPELTNLESAIAYWRNNPFKPYAVAQFRTVAYQKAVVMQYINNLIQWGDYLFSQDTMESIVQATQMYVLADKLLGPKPLTVPPIAQPPYETYNQIVARLDAFGNALIDLENIIPDLSALPEGGAELPPPPVTLSMLYFCIPPNAQMLSYWDLIADRLFKIRNSEDINGVPQTLSLFSPPIDPGMLVRAAAAGLSLSSILAGMNAPTPYYRFNTLSQKATELIQEVRSLGNALLQALEKKDAENLALLRSSLEINVLNAVLNLKTQQLSEATQQIDVLNKTRAVTAARNVYYTNIAEIIPNEQLNLDKLSESHDYQMAAQIVQASAGVLALIPDLVIGAAGFGGSPTAAAKWGGTFLAHAAGAAASVLGVLSTASAYEANRASILGGYTRRYSDWQLQAQLSALELNQIDSQIAAATIRQEIAQTDVDNQNLQISNAQQLDKFMHTKFTNNDLYQWMVGQISSVYYGAYQVAFDFAKKAERCYQFELGRTDTFIQYGYWDSTKKGLQSADQLFSDLKRMETSYIDNNKREYELTKNVSLAILDPLALVALRATGTCNFAIPEALFDMDYAGQYFRRLKSVSISLPCIAGPYTSVSAKLSLVSNKYRSITDPGAQYEEDLGKDSRFIYNVGSIQSIAASNCQNDSGLFELNFRDERYLPFEGTGAISNWELELPTAVQQFDYSTIVDVILHIKYTAREGGSSLKTLAQAALKDQLAAIQQQISQTGLHVAINLKNDMPNEWYLLKKNGTVNITIDQYRLPYFAQSLASAIVDVMFIAKVTGNPTSYSITIDGAVMNQSRVDAWELCTGDTKAITLSTSFALAITNATQLGKLEELMMVVKYSF